MHPGFDSTSLTIFTALAPAGAVCMVVFAIILLICPFVDDACRNRLNHLVAIPLFISWAGFIASATHLGTPANALYVFSRVGASPLSNEVTSVVVFLFIAGVFWLLSFRKSFPLGVQKVFLLACIISAVAMVLCMGFAYDVETVPTWHTKLVPLNLVLLATVGGFSISILVLDLGAYPVEVWVRRLLVMAAVLLCIAGVALACYLAAISGFENNAQSVAARAPYLWGALAVFVLSGYVGLAMQWYARYRLEGLQRRLVMIIGCAIVLAAMYFARIPFYAAYLSAGF